MFSASRVSDRAERADGRVQLRHRRRSRFLRSVEGRPRADADLGRRVSIGDGAWMGAGAKILDGVTIGAHAVIGAGAVVRESVPAGPSPSASRRASSRPALPAPLVRPQSPNVESRSPSPKLKANGPTRHRHLQPAVSRRRASGHRASLVAAARDCRPRRHLVITPDCQFGRQASAYVETWRTDVNAGGRPEDRSGHQPAVSELRRQASGPRVLAEPHDARVLRPLAAVLGGPCRRGDGSRKGSSGSRSAPSIDGC